MKRVEWAEFAEQLDVRAGEHVTIVGPTGRGKSTLALEVAARRPYIAWLATKPRDDSMRRQLRAAGYKITAGHIPAYTVAPRFALWPSMRSIADTSHQRATISNALDRLFQQGNRLVVVDETHYVSEVLRQSAALKILWQQGRSTGVGLLANFQRPAWVPRDAYSNATHLFLFGTNDEQDARALGGIGGISSKAIRQAVMTLASNEQDRHAFCYINTRTGVLLCSAAPSPKQRT